LNQPCTPFTFTCVDYVRFWFFDTSNSSQGEELLPVPLTLADPLMVQAATI
jgi:hypothetical protein